MKFRIAGLLFALWAFGLGRDNAHAAIQWETNYYTALSRAQMLNRPLFIDFYTDWCGWCKKLDAEVYPDARVQNAAANMVMLKLNAEGSGASLSRTLGVTGFPTLIFLNPQGQLLQKIPGYVPAADLTRVMEAMTQRNAKSSAPPASVAATQPEATRPGARAKGRTARPVARSSKSLLPSTAAGRTKVSTLMRFDSAPTTVVAQQRHALQRASADNNQSGVFLLDENGAVALNPPTKQPKLAQQKTKSAPSTRRARSARKSSP